MDLVQLVPVTVNGTASELDSWARRSPPYSKVETAAEWSHVRRTVRDHFCETIVRVLRR
jgi:hypothetical protein